MKEFTISYQLYTRPAGDPDGITRQYKCKDIADYVRCVNLYKNGHVYFVAINGRPVTTQYHYPSYIKRLNEGIKG